jgi:hypothetical protein
MKIVPAASLTISFFKQKTVDAAPIHYARPGIFKLASCCLSTSYSNLDHYTVPELEADYARLATLRPDDPATVPLWKKIQHSLIVDSAWAIFLGFEPVYNVWNADRVAALPLTASSITQPSPYFAGVTMKRR